LRRRQLEAYLNKVFDGSARGAALPEGRPSPSHPWPKVFDGVFWGAAIPIPKVHRREAECQRGILRQRLFPLLRRLAGARGRTPGRRRDAQGRAVLPPSVSRRMAVVRVSTDFPLPWGVRFQREGEDEVAWALALLQPWDRPRGRRFLDGRVGDALYRRSDFVEAVEKLQREGVFTIQENQPERLAQAQPLTGGPPQRTCSTPQEEFPLGHAPETYGRAAHRSVQVVKTFRLQKKQRVALTPSGSPEKRKRGKEEVREESSASWATFSSRDAWTRVETEYPSGCLRPFRSARPSLSSPDRKPPFSLFSQRPPLSEIRPQSRPTEQNNQQTATLRGLRNRWAGSPVA
jgi:hypothetical protein